MAKKRHRTGGRGTGKGTTGMGRGKRRAWLNTPSLVFIGMLVLIAAAVAAASMLGGDDPDCPPGQVWSDAHNHCH